MSAISFKHISVLFSKTPVLKKLSHNLISQGSIFTGKWIFNFTLAKLLPPYLFGIFTFTQALGNFLMNCFSFGAVSHLIHGISEDKSSAFSQLQKSLNITVRIVIVASLVWLAALLLEADIPNLNYLFWAIIIGGVMSLNAQVFAFFKGLGEFSKEAKAAQVFCASSIVIVLGFWFFSIVENIHILLASFCVLQCILLAKGIGFIKEWRVTSGYVKASVKKDYWKEKIPFGLHEIQGAFYIHVIILILGLMVPEEQLAMYRSVQLFITPVSLLPSVVSQVTLNRLSALKDSPLKQIKTFRKFLLAVSSIGLLLFIAYGLFGGMLINYAYDYKFDVETVNYLIMCFSAAFMLRFISSNYGVIITSAGKQSIRVLMTFLSIVVSVSVTYILTKSMGVKGAALAGVASFGVITIGYSIYCEAILFKQLRKNASNNFRS